jgi:beta-phosphoglucomutase family hydrolase
MTKSPKSRPRAVLFDLDGVLTPTAAVHRRAWRAVFEDYFRANSIAPAYSERDYFEHIDGMPRHDGVRALLASRGVEAPPAQLVAALADAKNAAFKGALESDGVTPYPGTAAVLQTLAEAGLGMAVVSSSANARSVLAAAGLGHFFGLVVDGGVAREQGLRGKPAPDTYRFAALSLGLAPRACAVVEDAVAGARAGRAGGFGLVVGVDRGAGAAELTAAGAGLVIAQLTQLPPLFGIAARPGP